MCPGSTARKGDLFPYNVIPIVDSSRFYHVLAFLSCFHRVLSSLLSLNLSALLAYIFQRNFLKYYIWCAVLLKLHYCLLYDMLGSSESHEGRSSAL